MLFDTFPVKEASDSQLLFAGKSLFSVLSTELQLGVVDKRTGMTYCFNRIIFIDPVSDPSVSCLIKLEVVRIKSY